MDHALFSRVLTAADDDAACGEPDASLPALLQLATPQTPADEILATYRARFAHTRRPLIQAELERRRDEHAIGIAWILERMQLA